ncbi:MAG: alanine:cation symporter family protein, partial [Oscillospiraceae bacterium]|nr:alanine:cation symporter family protein [Oscillospiraceae bacterium]
RGLAALFAGAGIAASLVMADAVPSGALGGALETAWNVPPAATGLALTAFTAAVVFGGGKRITAAATVVVRALCLFYLVICGAAFVLHAAVTARALGRILSGAFSLRAGLGGLVGGAVRHGLAKGVFSHEAGMGTDPLFAASTGEDDPHRQALVSMTGPFLDTVAFCSLTALVILAAGTESADPTVMTREAFARFFPGWGGFAADATLTLLVLATLSSWAFCGEACLGYFTGDRRARWAYRALYCAVPAAAAGLPAGGLLTLGDAATALMAVPNMALCLVWVGEAAAAAGKTGKNRRRGGEKVDKPGKKRGLY